MAYYDKYQPTEEQINQATENGCLEEFLRDYHRLSEIHEEYRGGVEARIVDPNALIQCIKEMQRKYPFAFKPKS